MAPTPEDGPIDRFSLLPTEVRRNILLEAVMAGPWKEMLKMIASLTAVSKTFAAHLDDIVVMDVAPNIIGVLEYTLLTNQVVRKLWWELRTMCEGCSTAERIVGKVHGDRGLEAADIDYAWLVVRILERRQLHRVPNRTLATKQQSERVKAKTSLDIVLANIFKTFWIYEKDGVLATVDGHITPEAEDSFCDHLVTLIPHISNLPSTFITKHQGDSFAPLWSTLFGIELPEKWEQESCSAERWSATIGIIGKIFSVRATGDIDSLSFEVEEAPSEDGIGLHSMGF